MYIEFRLHLPPDFIWVTLTYFSRSQRLIKEKVCHHDISTPTLCTTSILIPVIHMMKLKIKLKDGWHLPIFQGHWLIKEEVCHHDISAPTMCIMKFKDGWHLPIFQGHWLIKEHVCHHDISAPTICIISIIIPLIHRLYDKTQSQFHLFVTVTDADKSWFIQFVSL